MSFPKTNIEIINDALFRAGEPTDGSSDYEQKALDYLNRVYTEIAAGGNTLDPSINVRWWWLRSETPQVVTLLPVETGAVQVTNGSTAIVFSVAPAISLAGRHFRTTGGTQDVFRIASHTAADPNAVLDSVYTGPTSGSIGYEASKLEYDLPAGVMEIISPMRVYKDGKREIEGMELSALEHQYPLSNQYVGVPNAFAQIGTRKIRFSHQGGSLPEELIRVDFDYLVLPTNVAKDMNEVLVPEEFRKTLADFVCMLLLADKDDSKAGDIGKMARSGLQGMAMEHKNRSTQIAPSYGHIYPRPARHSSRRYPLRTTGGRIIGS